MGTDSWKSCGEIVRSIAAKLKAAHEGIESANDPRGKGSLAKEPAAMKKSRIREDAPTVGGNSDRRRCDAGCVGKLGSCSAKGNGKASGRGDARTAEAAYAVKQERPARAASADYHAVTCGATQ